MLPIAILVEIANDDLTTQLKNVYSPLTGYQKGGSSGRDSWSFTLMASDDASSWCPNLGPNRKDLHSQYVTLTFKLNACYLPPHYYAEIPGKKCIIDPIVYLKASEDLGQDLS
ncbi:hypothetical protein ACTXT7_003848 [Hymenolepis weldensis]